MRDTAIIALCVARASNLTPASPRPPPPPPLAKSATLRHALLLEERGLQLEEAEEMLRRKGEEEAVLRRELQRLAEASVVDRVRKGAGAGGGTDRRYRYILFVRVFASFLPICTEMY